MNINIKEKKIEGILKVGIIDIPDNVSCFNICSLSKENGIHKIKLYFDSDNVRVNNTNYSLYGTAELEMRSCISKEVFEEGFKYPKYEYQDVLPFVTSSIAITYFKRIDKSKPFASNNVPDSTSKIMRSYLTILCDELLYNHKFLIEESIIYYDNLLKIADKDLIIKTEELNLLDIKSNDLRDKIAALRDLSAAKYFAKNP